jgi:hypothetical protein
MTYQHSTTLFLLPYIPSQRILSCLLFVLGYGWKRLDFDSLGLYNIQKKLQTVEKSASNPYLKRVLLFWSHTTAKRCALLCGLIITCSTSKMFNQRTKNHACAFGYNNMYYYPDATIMHVFTGRMSLIGWKILIGFRGREREGEEDCFAFLLLVTCLVLGLFASLVFVLVGFCLIGCGP